jgi:hypothetical protein
LVLGDFVRKIACFSRFLKKYYSTKQMIFVVVLGAGGVSI